MEIFLPENVGTRDVAALFELCAKVRSTSDNEVTLDASKVQFFDPFGLAVLGALLGGMDDRRITMPWLQVEHAGYLARMNFFKYVDVQDVELPNWGRSDRRDRLTELTKVESHTDCDEAANRLADAITGTLTSTRADPEDYRGKGSQHERFRYPLWYSLSELLENSLTHARQGGRRNASVWVAAQYFEGNSEVKLAVVDDGCGMLETLKRHEALDERTHHGAIRAALKARVSCNRDGTLYNTQGNQGVGLTTTARIAEAAGGGLIIVSGDAVHRTKPNSGATGLLPRDGWWNGVATCFHCRRSRLPSVRVGALLPEDETAVDINFSE